jgi:hypothetical protein
VAILLARLGVPLSWPEIFRRFFRPVPCLLALLALASYFPLDTLVDDTLNAEIEHGSPHGKDKGEKVPGEKEDRAA